jgi:ubiquinone/menaquinone biosynthesis C-methylase UbiE
MSERTIHALEAIERAQWIAMAPFVFQAACALRDRGILRACEAGEGLTLDELAESVGLSVYGTRVLVEAGLGMNALEVVDGRYMTTKIGWVLLHDDLTRANMDFTRDVAYRGLAHLDEAVVTGRPAGLKEFGSWPTIYAGLAELPAQVRTSWFAFDHHHSDTAFAPALRILFRRPPRKLLDIGGNTGKFARACLRHDANVQITLVDLPGQLEDAKRELSDVDGSQRVSFHPTNLLEPGSEIPSGFDAIWLSQFLDCFSEAEIVAILRRCVAALAPGGRIYVLEPFWDRQRFGAAKFCLQMTSLYFTAIANGNSQMYGAYTFLECVAKAELVIEEQHDGLGNSHTLLVCNRPA